jgi:1-deoxy-D-xylulose-5-phosphate reductoisomerase
MKLITILGSTGSIGKSALDIVTTNRDKFKVFGLTAGNNISLLEQQIQSFSPQVVAVADEESARELRKRMKGKAKSSTEILAGQKGVSDVAAHSGTDFVLSAIVGAAGLMPTLAAIHAGKKIGLANKEALVMAGKIVMREASKSGSKILPVDSEHSAIFQCMAGHRKCDVKRIILTASGGPFVGKSKKSLDKITPEQALNHPRWKMGKKITIDSATLMNKGFEVIEAHHLFGLPPERIDVVVHPESIVHSIVEFNDGACIAQLSVPDMKGPIAYALTYPKRLCDVIDGLSLHDVGSLTFRKPENRSFPCLSYAYAALEAGGTMPSVMNAANEVAVNAFLSRKIRFTDVPLVIRKIMDRHTVMTDTELGVVMEADRWARERARKIVKELGAG